MKACLQDPPRSPLPGSLPKPRVMPLAEALGPPLQFAWSSPPWTVPEAKRQPSAPVGVARVAEALHAGPALRKAFAKLTLGETAWKTRPRSLAVNRPWQPVARVAEPQDAAPIRRKAFAKL